MDIFTRQVIDPKWETSQTIKMNIDTSITSLIYVITDNIEEITQGLSRMGVNVRQDLENTFRDELRENIKRLFQPFMDALTAENPTTGELLNDTGNPIIVDFEHRMRRIYMRLERRRNEYRRVLPLPDDGRASAPHAPDISYSGRGAQRPRLHGHHRDGISGPLASIWPAIEILTRIAEHLRI